MASDRQIAANRKNAKKSTGPSSEAGKRRSAKNAFRHGLASSDSPFRKELEELAHLALRGGWSRCLSERHGTSLAGGWDSHR